MPIRIASKFRPGEPCVIFQGDCLELLQSMPDGCIDLVVTSPPYNIGKSYESRLDLDTYAQEQASVIAQCCRVLKPTGSLCWQVGNYVVNGSILPLDIVLYPLFEKKKLILRNRIIWHFGHGLHAKRRFSGRYETILWFTKTDDYYFDLDPVRVPQKYPGKKHFKGPNKGRLSGNPLGKNPSDIWEIPNVKANHVEKTAHPCQFPVELIERLVLALTPEDGVVLDPFAGVGSAAIAALMHRRKFVGAELLPEYVSIAMDRIRKADAGTLLVRPMLRPVYDPKNPTSNLPPEVVTLPKQRNEKA